MKRIVHVILLLVLLLVISGCSEKTVKFTVDFFDEDFELIESMEIEKGKDVLSYPKLIEEEGYYFTWDLSLEDLKNIQENKTVTAIKNEYRKNVKYYIDDVLFFEHTCLYSSHYRVPEVTGNYESYEWKETKKETIETTIYFVYNLEYKIRETYNITYYDGSTKLSLSPSTFNVNATTELPVAEKEGYHFVGWFPSTISLTKYTVLGGIANDVTLYARFIEIEKSDLIELPEAKYHFTETRYSSTWQPVMPSGAPSGVTNYTWTTSNSNIATVSMWSSITIKNGGFCVLTATHNTDPSIVINAIIKVSADGVSISSEAEANTIVTHKVTFVDKENYIMETQTVLEGQYAIAPTPKYYEGYAFAGWDKDFYNVKEDLTVKATYVAGENKYAGKTFSIIGDSISTYQDYVPAGYATFYPYPSADVNDVNQTWWMQSINKLGASLYINNSYSGSCVADDGSSSSSNKGRLQNLVLNGKSADVIVIFMGSNDARSIQVGTGITETSFNQKYGVMIETIYELCGEDVEIILCTLPTSKLYNDANKEKVNNVINNYASQYELQVIDFASLDISEYLCDSAHPLTSGMTIMANKVVEELLGK